MASSSAWGIRVVLNVKPRQTAWALFGPDHKPAELTEQGALVIAEQATQASNGVAEYFAASFAAVERMGKA